MLGGGAWTAKSKKKFRKKYFVGREQYVRMEAPSLKGTKLYSAVSGIDVGGPGKTLLALHQGVRDVAKLGLKEYKNLLDGGSKFSKFSSNNKHYGGEYDAGYSDYVPKKRSGSPAPPLPTLWRPALLDSAYGVATVSERWKSTQDGQRASQ